MKFIVAPLLDWSLTSTAINKMSQFELIYLIILRSDSITNILIFFSSIQIAAFIGAYFIREMPDRVLRHAIAAFYWLALLISAGKNNIDVYFISRYTKELYLLYQKNPSLFSDSPVANYNTIFDNPTLLAFAISFNALYGGLAIATMYFLYLHKFNKS